MRQKIEGQKNYRTTSQMTLKVFLTFFFENVLPIAPKKSPKMSEETKQKKFPEESP